MERTGNRPHILLCGEKQAGKSTLIARLIARYGGPVYGFMTKMDPPGSDGFHEIYMYPASMPVSDRIRSRENLIGRCDSRTHEVNTEVFETLGVQLIKEAKPGGLIIMDELGFMEQDAALFTEAVLTALKGDIPVLAAVKARYDVPFLNRVRSAEKTRVCSVDEHNRDDLFEKIIQSYSIFR